MQIYRNQENTKAYSSNFLSQERKKSRKSLWTMDNTWIKALTVFKYYSTLFYIATLHSVEHYFRINPTPSPPPALPLQMHAGY